MTSKHGRQTQGGTPGRRANITDNQYFDVGRVGRKTGITLRDTGIRDDYGLEPMSGIFSSPASPQQSVYDEGSADMEGLNSTMPDVEETIQSRKRSRMLAAQATPRRANIGEPYERHLTQSQPPFSSPDTAMAYRKLDLGGNGVRVSIEKQSPFKPRHVLRRSSPGLGVRENRQPHARLSQISNPPSVRRTSQGPKPRTPAPQLADNDDSLFIPQDDALPYSPGDEVEGGLSLAQSILQNPSPDTGRKRRRTEDASRMSYSTHYTPPVPPMASAASQKRPRRSADREGNPSSSRAEGPQPASHQKRPPISEFSDDHPAFGDQYMSPMTEYDDDDGDDGGIDAGDFGDDGYDEVDEGEQTAHSVPEAAALSRRQAEKAPVYDDPPGNDYNDPGDYDDDVSVDLPEDAVETNGDVDEDPQPSTRPKAQRARAPSNRPKGRERSQRAQSVHSDSGSDEETSRSQRSGSRSNVRLRSTTPFEDATRTTRSGRAVIKPLEWWAGEAVIWKNGEVDGVIRAQSVEPEKRTVNKKRNAHKKKTSKLKAGLDAIDEQDEDQLPSDWEDEIGVLQGDVATWDPDTEFDEYAKLVTTDLAFAASSMITKAVQGHTFNYAKIQTLPWFGSGIVELPPDGLKATKNSRKMQMNFFVHKGKVLVTIHTPIGPSRPEAEATSVFNISEGGAWIVPRGNNYSIANVSSSTTAVIFFAQGCEVDAEDREEAAAA